MKQGAPHILQGYISKEYKRISFCVPLIFFLKANYPVQFKPRQDDKCPRYVTGNRPIFSYTDVYSRSSECRSLNAVNTPKIISQHNQKTPQTFLT